MKLGLKYDNIPLPKKVSEMLEDDFCVFNNVNAQMAKAVTSPVKFSAYTSIYLREGSCSANINLLTHTITAPAIVNIRSSQIMQPFEVSENFRASFVILSKRLTEAISAHLHDYSILAITNRHPVVPLTTEMSQAMDSLYEDLVAISSDNTISHRFEAILHTLSAFLFRNMEKCYSGVKNIEGKSNISNRMAERFLFLVQQNFRKERFLEFYADQLEISTKHLTRIVKEHTGYSPTEWITRHVILEAKVMLTASTLNIQQIAQELNFPSQSFFGKYFKKATGVSPKDFRNS